MTIRLRILALLSVLTLFCIGMTEYFARLHVREEATEKERQRQVMTTRLERLLKAAARPATGFLDTVAGRAGLREFLEHRDAAWAETNVRSLANRYAVEAVWILKADGTVLLDLDQAPDLHGKPPSPALAWPEVFRNNATFSFHVFRDGQLWQIQGRPVGAVGSASPSGWVVVGQRWGEQVLGEFNEGSEGTVVLTGPAHIRDVRGEEELELWHPLPDHQGRIVAGLDYHLIDASLEDPAVERIERILFVLNGVGAILLVALCLHLWFLRPFALLKASLEARDTTQLTSLLGQKNEFGQMAAVIRTAMEDRAKLQQSLDERVRLGRDLHDGAIQSIYGTRMALSCVQSLMGRDLPAAQKLLEETVTELNRLLLELRRHLEAVDPKPLDGNFREAVLRLIRQLQGPTPLAVELEIDEELVASHPALHRSQALQFVREAVSNALRHGRPAHLTVAWQRTSAGSTLTVTDDGAGFDPASVAPGGRGLGNLRERALSLGGRLEIDSRPGEGTRLSLQLSTPSAPSA